MGLLRATADAVLVGAGTVRSGHHHVWTPGHVHPASAPAYAAWRAQLGLPHPQPTTVIVSASGRIDPAHPGLHAADVPVVLLTTDAGAAWLRRIDLPAAVEVVVAGDDERVEEDAILAALAARDLDLVVCEGGPRLLGGLVGAGLVDELFLTIAPQIAGRTPSAAARARRRPRLLDRRGPVGEPGLRHAIGRSPVPALPDVRSSRPRGRPSSVGLPAGALRRMGRTWPDAVVEAVCSPGCRSTFRRSSSRDAVAGRRHRRCARRARPTRTVRRTARRRTSTGSGSGCGSAWSVPTMRGTCSS